MTSILLAIVLTHGFVGVGQRQDLPFKVRDAKYWKWRELPWVTEDKVFSERRKLFDALMERGDNSLPLLIKSANDAKKQFEAAAKPEMQPLLIWTYAAFRARALDRKSISRTSFVDAINSLERIQPQGSYEYFRTRFLAMSDQFPKEYLPVGRRLLQRDKDDYSVKYYYVRLLNITGSHDEAKRLSGELLRDWPKKIGVYSLMGDTYYIANMNNSSKAELLQAKKYYEIFLQKAPSSNYYIPTVKWRLKNIEKKLSGG